MLSVLFIGWLLSGELVMDRILLAIGEITDGDSNKKGLDGQIGS